ncbi:MAG TPA: hypothetical protein VNZ57_00225 [Longimicrobiales bacterium]|nr:hypothetical protein [Longimicrobiales bacterium]
MRINAWIAAALCVSAVGCIDRTFAPDEFAHHERLSGTSSATTLVELRCRVDSVEGTFTCGAPVPPGVAAASGGATIGGQHRFARLVSTNVVTDPTVSVTADVTVQNLTLQPWGTNGSELAGGGVRVFFHSPPTNGVEVVNPTGRGLFTGPSQPYFQYAGTDLGDGILSPAEISSPKQWQFALNGETTFEFTVFIYATVPEADSLAVTFTTVEAGIQHTCGITTDNRAYCWGLNGAERRLGLGDTDGDNRNLPAPVVGGHSFKQIAVGSQHTCALDMAGAAWCWGSQVDGRLGNGETSGASGVPVAVSDNHVFQSIYAGNAHTCGIDTDGDTWCWGVGDAGRLGNGSSDDQDKPVAVLGGHKFDFLFLGDTFSCGVEAGKAWCWGLGSQGAMGNGTIVTTNATPVDVTMPLDGGGDEVKFLAGSAGGSGAGAAVAGHACAIADDGNTYCWGNNSAGQIGIGSAGGTEALPRKVDTTLQFDAIAAGVAATCGIASGAIYCWGLDTEGQLGNGAAGGTTTPGAVVTDFIAAFEDVPEFTHISALGRHFCAMGGGEAYCWGQGVQGQIGNGLDGSRNQPVWVSAAN